MQPMLPHGLNLKVLVLGAGMLLVMASGAGSATVPAGPEEAALAALLQTQADGLMTVASDDQALSLFTTRLGPSLGLEEREIPQAGKRPAGQASGKRSGDEPPATDRQEAAIRLTAELAVWRLASALRLAADGDPDGITTALLPDQAHRNWLVGRTGTSNLRAALHLASVLGARPPSQIPLTDPLPGLHEYASRLDAAYPKLSGSDDSWVALAEAGDLGGISQRLIKASSEADDSARQALSSRYFDTRLRPLLTAHLAARAVRAEAEAQEAARRQWQTLRLWRERLAERRGLLRLCGAWQWTMHNHQNHQEHKMVMTFGPPDAPDGPGPRPARIVVLGDAVYLRWEFERGIVQEDSLLFAGEGQRLEGTFVNSGGPWGSITARRAAACSGIETSGPPGSGRAPPRGLEPDASGPSRR